jgi:hypothetical protein
MPTEFLDLKVTKIAPEFSMSKQSMISSMGRDHPMAALYAEDSAPNQLITVEENGPPED